MKTILAYTFAAFWFVSKKFYDWWDDMMGQTAVIFTNWNVAWNKRKYPTEED